MLLILENLRRGSDDNVFLIESWGGGGVGGMVMSLNNNTILRFTDAEDQMPIITVNASLTRAVTPQDLTGGLHNVK